MKIKCLRCKKSVRKNSNNHKRCAFCAKEIKISWRRNHREKINEAKRVWAKNNPQSRRAWINNNPEKVAATRATLALKKFLLLLNFSENYSPKEIISNVRVSNSSLEKIANRGGYPDFRDESLEEKGPKPDAIRVTHTINSLVRAQGGK